MKLGGDLTVQDEIEGEKEQRERERERERVGTFVVKGLGDLVKVLSDMMSDLVEELGENELIVGGLVPGRGIFQTDVVGLVLERAIPPTGVIVGIGIFCKVS